METIFRGENILEFTKHFSDDQTCLEFISQEKWKDNFICKHCGHHRYFEIKEHLSRECTKCKYIESTTA